MESIDQKLNTAVEDLNTDIVSLKTTVNRLCCKVQRQEIEIARIQDELNNQTAQNMKYNVIFNFDKQSDVGREIEGENCVGVVKKFLNSVMHI